MPFLAFRDASQPTTVKAAYIATMDTTAGVTGSFNRLTSSGGRVPGTPQKNRTAYSLADPAAGRGFGPVHVHPWISQPVAPFLRTNVICAVSRIGAPRCLNV